VLLEHPHAQFQVDVGGRHPPHLARPGPGLQHREDELAEVTVGDRPQDLLALLGREHAVAVALRRLLHGLDRVGLQHPLGVGPVEGPLHGDDGVTAAALPARVGVEPAGHVQRLQVPGQERAVQLAEVLEVLLVAAVGALGVVLLGVVEEQVADRGDADGVGRGQLPLGGGHQAVVRLHDRVGRHRRWVTPLALAGRWDIVGVLAEAVAGAADLDEPGVLGGPVPRMMRTHEQFSRFHG
jgi:hypothetical protein